MGRRLLFYHDDKWEKVWDGSGVNYKSEGIQVPTIIKSYTILSSTCLFHDFPIVSSKFKYGRIVLNCAVGKITKKVKFMKYDADYISLEMKSVKVYLKNSIKWQFIMDETRFYKNRYKQFVESCL